LNTSPKQKEKRFEIGLRHIAPPIVQEPAKDVWIIGRKAAQKTRRRLSHNSDHIFITQKSITKCLFRLIKENLFKLSASTLEVP
jgi:hypothetical protein